jgi:hypothetical protein
MKETYNVLYDVYGFEEENRQQIIDCIRDNWAIHDSGICNSKMWSDIDIIEDMKKPPNYIHMIGHQDFDYDKFASEDEFMNQVKNKIWDINKSYCQLDFSMMFDGGFLYKDYFSTPAEYNELCCREVK